MFKKGTKVVLISVEAEDEWVGLTEGSEGLFVRFDEYTEDLAVVNFNNLDREEYWVFIDQVKVLD